MKAKSFIIAAALMMTLAACNHQENNQVSNQNSQNMNNNQQLQEVAGRKNFGSQHALVTTPQPCVMIATWDKDHNPDVMMAAWAGQLDYNQIVISLTLLTSMFGMGQNFPPCAISQKPCKCFGSTPSRSIAIA